MHRRSTFGPSVNMRCIDNLLMKRLFSFLIFALTMYSVSAQEAQPQPSQRVTKPLLFSNLPEVFEVDKSELQKVFDKNLHENVRLQLSPTLYIDGRIVDKTQHNPGSLTVNIRVANYANALFNVTLRLLADNSTAMQGRILHPRYGDVLQLYKEQEKYFIKKNSQALVMPE